MGSTSLSYTVVGLRRQLMLTKKLLFQEPIFLDKCVICWEQDWEDYYEIQEFVAKEAFIFKVNIFRYFL